MVLFICTVVKSTNPTSHTGWEILISKANQVCFNHRMRPPTRVPVWALKMESIAICPCYTSFPPFKEDPKFHFQLFVFFKSKDSGTDIKCQLFFCCQKENHSCKSIKTKGQMPLIKLLGFLFWFERVWHFKQPFLFHSLLLACVDCLFQMPVIDIKHKVEMTSVQPAPSCVLPVLYSLTVCFTQV